MAAESARPTLLVIDANPFRRASVASFLADWARTQGLTVAQASPESVLGRLGGNSQWRCLVLSVGGGTIARSDVHMLLRVLHVLAPEVPAVIMSDRDDPEEIMLAYRENCRGYLSTGMSPQLALRAISFILEGGSFFPPTVLPQLGRGKPNPNGGDALPYTGSSEPDPEAGPL